MEPDIKPLQPSHAHSSAGFSLLSFLPSHPYTLLHPRDLAQVSIQCLSLVCLPLPAPQATSRILGATLPAVTHRPFSMSHPSSPPTLIYPYSSDVDQETVPLPLPSPLYSADCIPPSPLPTSRLNLSVHPLFCLSLQKKSTCSDFISKMQIEKIKLVFLSKIYQFCRNVCE